MTVTQRFQPPFALADVDAVALDFTPALATNDTLSSPVVIVSGGFTVGTPEIGDIDVDGNFTAGAGNYLRVMLTATAVGTWTVTFTATVSGGRILHRTERQDVVAARS
jgi:hypothetical protein